MSEKPKSAVILFIVLWSILTLGVVYAAGAAAVAGNIPLLEIMVIVGVILAIILSATEDRDRRK